MSVKHLAMSDDDFLNQPPPETVGASSDMSETPAADPAPEEKPAATAEEPQVETPVETPAETPDQEAPKDAPNPLNVPDDELAAPAPAAPKQEEKPADTKEGEQKPAETPAEPKPDAPGSKPEADKGQPADGDKKPEEPAAPPNYEELYNQIMKPFTANGKEIKLQNPAEAVQLMQMGANYTRKMQELAPHRKLLTMLTQHELLDENKLSFLIDLDKKNPEAIKRLIKESGIDPLDLDMTTEPDYREGSHKVSDEEQRFRTVLEDVSSTQEGKAALVAINETWDQASKEVLWQHPDVLPIIAAQRQSGIYALIEAEVDRLTTLGQLSSDEPFINRYHKVGDALDARGAFNHLRGNAADTPAAPAPTPDPAPAPAATPEPVVVRTQAPKPAVTASDKVAAAASSRTSPAKAQEAPNFLAMSDEDFAKVQPFAGRV